MLVLPGKGFTKLKSLQGTLLTEAVYLGLGLFRALNVTSRLAGGAVVTLYSFCRPSASIGRSLVPFF